MTMQRFDMRDATNRPAGLAAARAALADGMLVAIPTETVYGLAADATQGRAVAGIYAAKGRPSFNPLIAHVDSLAMAHRFGRLDATAIRLADAFWPGPLTLVVPLVPGCGIADLTTAGLDTIGLRMPGNDVARTLITSLGRPLAAPSANLSGRISATSADDVAADLGDRIAVLLDDGPTPIGVESTILSCTGDGVTILRPGGVAREAIEAVLGHPVPDARPPEDPERPLAPGMLASHYAPDARIRLDAREVRPGEAWLGFGPHKPAGLTGTTPTRNLSASGDLAEAAANLFRDLRALDASGTGAIAVAPIPEHGLGEAINDRLRRAAAPR